MNNDTVKFLAIAVGVALLTPLALALASGAARPLGRAAARAGGVMYEKTREVAAELEEIAEDFMAEARREMNEQTVSGVETAEDVADTASATSDAA
jgi:hypothetical protein